MTLETVEIRSQYALSLDIVMMNVSDKKEQFFSLSTASDVALLLDTGYDGLSKLIYKSPLKYRYLEFEIKKKNGGKRIILSPNQRIKEIQRKLADILLELYDQKAPVHGFSKGRNILTNAQQHLNKQYIFNIDLQDFFPSISFGRVKKIFTEDPFLIPHSPATVLAHICCYDKRLPQGAPTSPVISNMICSKMDTALQDLAMKYQCIYSRYADDITFSFTCGRKQLPYDIVIPKASGYEPGNKLKSIITENGFKINNSKTRLCIRGQRLKVTGLTVNEFPNVRRAYVQQIKSMLYAWEKYGYEKAESEYIEKYYIDKIVTNKKPKYMSVVKGKLSFLQMVRGKDDPIYINLAKRFNKLIPENMKALPFQDKSFVMIAKQKRNIELSDEQKKILHLAAGKHVVLAPPGAGKTELLSQRIFKAIENRIEPEKMACLTFTNRAARNMKDRVGDASKGIFIGNFHSFGVHFLRKFNLFPKGQSILDEEDSDSFVKEAISNLMPPNILSIIESWKFKSNPNKGRCSGLNKNESELLSNYIIYLNSLELNPNLNKFLNNYFKIYEIDDQNYEVFSSWGIFLLFHRIKEFGKKFINILKTSIDQIHMGLPSDVVYSTLNLFINSWLSYEEYYRITNFNYFKDSRKEFEIKNNERLTLHSFDVLLLKYVVAVINEYENLKKSALAIDFDDILNLSLKHLIFNKKINKNNYKYDWIQVDEAQDLNATQWEILKKITHKDSHIVLFGDYGQSIFSFIGGDYKKLKEEAFEYNQHFLRENYRSPDNLICLFEDYAKKVLGFDISIERNGESEKVSKDPLIIKFYDNWSEKKYIVSKIIPSLAKDSNKDSKIAVLTRTNKEAIDISSNLENYGIDHFMVSQFDIFRNKNTKDFMSLLHVLQNPFSRLPWYRIFWLFGNVNTLKRSRKIVNELYRLGIHLPDFLISEGNINTFPTEDLQYFYRNRRIVIFDTETTGLNTNEVDIIQIAAVEVINGRPERKLDIYINTSQSLGDSVKIHNITRDHLDTYGIKPKDAFIEFHEFVNNDPLIAHNLKFDWKVLINNIKRHCKFELFNDSHPRYDTLSMATKLYPQEPRHKLGYLINKFGLSGKNTHNALDDVLATNYLLEKMISDYEELQDNIDGFIQRNKNYLHNFNKTFKPVWDKLNGWKGKITFREIFNYFFEYILKNFPNCDQSYCQKMDKKLIIHMDMCGEKSLENLLKDDLPEYMLYKEPDLILDNDKIIVSTVHRAKGLEFDSVIIPRCQKYVYPHFYSKTRDEIEEDKRLLYVAMTRAKQQLIITSIHDEDKLHIVDKTVSEFIDPIRSHFSEYDIGDCRICKSFFRTYIDSPKEDGIRLCKDCRQGKANSKH